MDIRGEESVSDSPAENGDLPDNFFQGLQEVYCNEPDAVVLPVSLQGAARCDDNLGPGSGISVHCQHYFLITPTILLLIAECDAPQWHCH